MAIGRSQRDILLVEVEVIVKYNAVDDTNITLAGHSYEP